MSKIKGKFKMYISLLIVFTLLLSTLVITAGGLAKNEDNTSPQLSNEEYEIVNDISNMTGAKAEDIIKLRNEGRAWNEILDELKYKDTNNDTDKRSALLAETGLDSNLAAGLKSDGFTNEEISEAKMLVERVIFQLTEITSESTAEITQLTDETGTTADQEEMSRYRDLAAKIDLDTAVYLLLKLKKDFGSLENVMDEYLYCLQIGIDMEQYLADKKKYREIREEKSAGVDINRIVTLAKIEEMLLKKINSSNSRNDNTNKYGNDNIVDKAENADQTEALEDPIPEPPIPDINTPIPRNPTDEIMQEINDIKDRSLNIDGAN